MKNKNKRIAFVKIFFSLFAGFFLCSLGMVLMLYADLGAAPWVTFHKGISVLTGLSFGRISQLTGLLIILVSIPLGIAPGLATILNMYFVGAFMDLIENSHILSTPSTFLGKILLLLLGMVILSVGIYFYLKNGLGAGPRDGLMLGLMRKLNRSVTIIKSSIEIIVLILGIILGGPFGIGTAITAFGSGYVLDSTFKIAKFDSKVTPQRTFKDDWEWLKTLQERKKSQEKQKC